MKTKNLLLLGIGVALGYLAFKKYQQNKLKTESQPSSISKTQSQCESEWNEKAKTMKLTQGAMQTAKANFMLSCSPVMIATI